MADLLERTRDGTQTLPIAEYMPVSEEPKSDLKWAVLRAAKWANRNSVGGAQVTEVESWKLIQSKAMGGTLVINKYLDSFHPVPTEFERYSSICNQAFDRISEESAEADHDAPPESVIREARRIVRGMLRCWARDYDVYPMDERRVAVEVDGGFGKRMLLVCEDGGSAFCVATVNRVSRRARYDDSRTLPDGFVWDALRDMGHDPSTTLHSIKVTYAH